MLSYLQNINHPNLLIVNFNDFICNYDMISKRINNFLDLNEKNHVHKYKHFNPNISVKNVGIYKSFNDISSIKLIEKELSNYWDFSSTNVYNN